MNVKTILVPLDGSIIAEAALAPAVDLARETGAKLVLLRAAEAQHRPMADPIDIQVELMCEAQEYLAGVRSRVLEAGVGTVEVSAWYGPPREAIVEAAQYRHADLIVMSSHGRSGVARLVLGSVAESVLDDGTHPVDPASRRPARRAVHG
jgi:nucleotide-binding universal stress UspA family protein